MLLGVMSKCKKPIKENTPAATSVMVMIPKSKGTEFLRKVFEKWLFSHERLPFQSNTLSKPDCKNKIAKNALQNIFERKLI